MQSLRGFLPIDVRDCPCWRRPPSALLHSPHGFFRVPAFSLEVHVPGLNDLWICLKELPFRTSNCTLIADLAFHVPALPQPIIFQAIRLGDHWSDCKAASRLDVLFPQFVKPLPGLPCLPLFSGPHSDPTSTDDGVPSRLVLINRGSYGCNGYEIEPVANGLSISSGRPALRLRGDPSTPGAGRWIDDAVFSDIALHCLHRSASKK